MLLTAIAMAPASLAAQSDVLLSLGLARSGASMATPRVLAAFDQQAAVQWDQTLRVEVRATDLGYEVRLAFKLYAADGSQLASVGAPVIVARYSEPASIGLSARAGDALTVRVTPVKVAHSS
jgi:acyl-CoA thioesterase FadM